jgi:hypothetical protein
LVFCWQKDPEYVLSQVSRVRILDFPFTRSPLLLTLVAALGYGRPSSAVTFFVQKLPTCAADDTKLADLAVRTQDSFLPTHTENFALKSTSLKAFLESGRIP